MWATPLLLCLSGALYPIALIAVLTYLGNARPMAHALAFLAGGVLITLVTGIALLAAFRLLDLQPDKRPTPSAAVEIGLGIGVVVVAVGWLVIRRRQLAATENSTDAGDDVTGAEGEAPLWRAFVTGVAVYLPMLSYFAAVKVVANQSVGAWTAVAMLVPCIIVSLAISWLPILVVATAGERSRPVLERTSRLVDRYAATILLLSAAAAGLYLVIHGFQRLAR